MKVSIIVPVYNAEKFLDRCLESIALQTYAHLEIILVNDGSTDQSGEICDEFARQDNRVKVIHKKNGGLSSARNAGLDIASGDYVFYLDSDDYLAKDCIERAVEISLNHLADIVILRMKYIPEDVNDEIAEEEEIREIVMLPEQAIEASLYQEKFSCCAPSKLYSVKIAKEVRFPIGKLSEDLATCHIFLSKAAKIVYSSQIGYYYRQQKSSIMHTFNPRRMDAMVWADQIETFCREKYPAILSAAKCRAFNVAIHLLLDLPNDREVHHKYYPMLWKAIRRTRISVLLNPKARFREKCAAVLSFGGEKLLKMIWNSPIAIRQG